MKFKYLIYLIILAVFLSCEKNEIIKVDDSISILTKETFVVTDRTAIIWGEIESKNDSAIIENGFYWGDKPNVEKSGKKLIIAFRGRTKL